MLIYQGLCKFAVHIEVSNENVVKQRYFNLSNNYGWLHTTELCDALPTIND